jgi:hypothetical protein
MLYRVKPNFSVAQEWVIIRFMLVCISFQRKCQKRNTEYFRAPLSIVWSRTSWSRAATSRPETELEVITCLLKFSIGLIEIPLAWLGTAVLVLDVEEIDSILNDPFCIGESITVSSLWMTTSWSATLDQTFSRWPTVDPTRMDRRFGTCRCWTWCNQTGDDLLRNEY